MEAIDELKSALQKITGIANKDLSILDKICSVKHYKKKELFLKSGNMPIYSGYVVRGHSGNTIPIMMAGNTTKLFALRATLCRL